MGTVFVTENVTRSFGGLVAVNNMSIAVEENSFTMLIGPNGCGKTTFLNVCTGLLKPDSGRVLFRGADITGWESHRVYDVGFVRTFQIPLPFLGLTVLDNVLGAMRNPGESPFRAPFPGSWIKQEEANAEKAFGTLRKVGLDQHWDKPCFALGAAQLKMLEVARGLSAGATLIALDEPIGGVDPASADEILSYVAGLKQQGLTFLVVEHRIDIAAPFADYVYAMNLGTLISQGPPDQVLSDPKVIEVYIGRDEAC